MMFLPDTNTCISLLRQNQPRLIERWQSVNVTDIVLCSVVVYELRHGAESSADPTREHAKLDVFLEPFTSLPFDDARVRRSAQRSAERWNEADKGSVRTRGARYRTRDEGAPCDSS